MKKKEERKCRWKKGSNSFQFSIQSYSATITFEKVENIYMNKTNKMYRNNFLSYIFVGVKT